MKQLVCEMCGGTDLIKQDGAFVCQNCGMKYSVEEAKKMMIEGTVEVKGNVQVQNAAQLDNLLQLAHSSYESKNYAQAEAFCNQVIAMDANNYDAWKLKGEAINFQITGKNDRITEVYNCIMTSYRVLDEEGKEKHRKEILGSLRECLEGEIDFALDLFMKNRPTDANLAKVKKTFLSCASNVITSYEELGYTKEDAEDYKSYIKSYFVKKVNKICEKSWKEAVFYNYNRDGWTEEYRPNVEIMKTYLTEGDNLLSLLGFATQYFDSKTPAFEKRENYRLQNEFQSNLINATSFKRMVQTTTNGYGAVTNRREYWQVDQTLNSNAKESRNKDMARTCKLFDEAELEMAKSDPKTKDRLISEWKKERDSLNLSLKFSTTSIVAVVLWAIMSIIGFFVLPPYCDGFEWFAPVVGVICGIVTVVFGVGAYKAAKDTQANNQAQYERLSKKIKDVE